MPLWETGDAGASQRGERVVWCLLRPLCEACARPLEGREALAAARRAGYSARVLKGLTVVDDPVTGDRWVYDPETRDWYMVDWGRIAELHESGGLDSMPPLQQALVGYMCLASEFA